MFPLIKNYSWNLCVWVKPDLISVFPFANNQCVWVQRHVICHCTNMLIVLVHAQTKQKEFTYTTKHFITTWCAEKGSMWVTPVPHILETRNTLIQPNLATYKQSDRQVWLKVELMLIFLIFVHTQKLCI